MNRTAQFTGFQPPPTRYLAGFALVATLHILATLGLLRLYGRFPGPAAPSPGLMTIFLHPAIHEDRNASTGPDLSRIVVALDAPQLELQVPTPPIAYDVSRNEGASVAAPILRPDNAVPIAPYIVQAALLPGEGATVVLRVEVLASGEPGRIEVDASSGSRQVDQAAIDFTRRHRWYAGRSNDVASSTWIRWGVRLQA